MKKALSHIFVVIVNFYFLTYLLGIFLMLLTIVFNGLPAIIGILTFLIALITSIIYQSISKNFKFYSFGEILIQNTDKSDILIQNKTMTVTRIPIFLLIILTLLFSGNILDGVSDGQIYTVGMVVIFSFLTYCTYYGMTGFMTNLKISSVFLLIAGLMLVGIIHLISVKLGKTGDIMFVVYLLLSIIWVVLGFVYESKKIKTIV